MPQPVTKRLDPKVLIVDQLALRGVGIKGLLRNWAEFHGVELDLYDPTQPADEPDCTYRLGILSLGHLSIGDRMTYDWLQNLRTMHPDTPVVAWSDLASAQEAVQALQHGLQGFVPTVTTPHLALQALTFIMSGGTYFPPEALIDGPPTNSPREAPAADPVDGLSVNGDPTPSWPPTPRRRGPGGGPKQGRTTGSEWQGVSSRHPRRIPALSKPGSPAKRDLPA